MDRVFVINSRTRFFTWRSSVCSWRAGKLFFSYAPVILLKNWKTTKQALLFCFIGMKIYSFMPFLSSSSGDEIMEHNGQKCWCASFFRVASGGKRTRFDWIHFPVSALNRLGSGGFLWSSSRVCMLSGHCVTAFSCRFNHRLRSKIRTHPQGPKANLGFPLELSHR